MTIKLEIDDALLEEAQRIGNHKTKADVVTVALEQYIERHKQQEELISMFGTIDYDPDYHYKEQRSQSTKRR